MAELTVEDYKRGARKAMEANDVEAAKRLIAKAREIDTSNQTETSQPVPDGSHRMPDGSVMKDSEMQSEGPDTSLGGALKQGYDQAGKMVGKGIQSGGELASNMGATNVGGYLQTSGREMAERNEAELEASSYQRPEGADGIIKNLKEGEYKNAGNSLLYGAAEAAPQVAGGVVASVGAGLAASSAPIIGTAAAIGGTAYGTVNALGQMRDEKEVQGLDPTATASDLGAAVASGLVELTPLKGGGATLKVLRETVQEGVQEGLVIGNTAVQGGEYVSEEVVNRIGDAAITGGALAKATNTVITVASKTGGMVLSDRSTLDPEVDQAAGDVARLLTDISKTEGADLKRVDASTQGTGKKIKKGANQALDEARSRINREVSNAAGILKNELGINNGPIEVKTQLEAAIAQSRNKVSSVVSNENIQFIKDNFGQTEQGQLLVAAFRKSNVVTELYAGGLKGGVSQFTDQFNPLPTFGRSYNPAGGVAGNLNAGAAVLTGGGSLAVQIPAVVGGRVIDAVTGRRSKVARFVKQNRKKAGFEAPTGTSVIGLAQARKDLEAQKRKAESQKKKQAAQVANDIKDEENAAQAARTIANGDPPNRGNESTRPDPRGVVWNSILDKRPEQNMTTKEIDAKIKSILYELQDVHKDSPERLSAIEQYLTYLETGRMGSEGRPLSEVAALVSGAWDATGPTSGGTNTSPNPGGANPKPLTPKEDGKQSNIAFNQELVDALNKSKVAPQSKAKLLKALGELRMNLGSDPVAKATEIIKRADVSKPLAKKYLKPYFDRIVAQQAAAKAKATAAAKGKKKKNDPKPTTPSPEPSPSEGPIGKGTTGTPTGPALQAKPTPLAKPVLTTPEAPKPKVKSVKAKLPEAKAIIEIGKKGSKYENGLQDQAMALEVAKILGITVQIMNSGTALQKVAGGSKGTRALHSWHSTYKGFGSKVFSIKSGGSFHGKPIDTLTALTDLLHEMGHSLTQGNIDGEGNFGGADSYNPLRGKNEYVGANSFNNTALGPILKKYGKDHPVIKEIHAFQEGGKAYINSDPTNKVDPRQLRELFTSLSLANNPANIKKLEASIKRVKDYTNMLPELSVDPMWLYLMNPKLAKQLMPQTSKLIQSEFAKAGNKKIQFYSHPLASVLAVVTAMVALGSGGQEEEEERQSTGVLTV